MSAELTAQYLPFFFALVPIASTLVRLGKTTLEKGDITTLTNGVNGRLPFLQTIHDVQFLHLPALSKVQLQLGGHDVEIEDQTDARSTDSKAVVRVDTEDNVGVWHGTRNTRTITHNEQPLFQIMHDKTKHGNFGDAIRMFRT